MELEYKGPIPGTPNDIHILGSGPNQRGDLFGRLVTDYFLTLGYHNCQLNVAKSGREVDVQAKHLTENRKLVAECKAHEDQIGGRDVNTFVGVLDAERRVAPGTEIVGYFVSLSGFKDSTYQQEQDTGNERA